MFQQKLSNLKRFVFAAMAFLALSASALAQNVTVTGRVRHVSVPEQTLVMEDGTEIPMEDVVSITGGISSPI